VTLKVRRGIVSLRTPKIVREIEAAFAAVRERGNFRLLHYSIQDDHAHLLVEAAGREALGRAMKALAARFARAVNRALRRAGRVLAERYHLEVLETPRQVRNALAYVLLNARKHLAERLRRRGKVLGATPLDPASSARWFDGWRGSIAAPGSPDVRARPVGRARTWLLSVGWRRHGLLDPLEVPGRGPRSARADGPWVARSSPASSRTSSCSRLGLPES
jgi:REP element-mobilizing transposase RayT